MNLQTSSFRGTQVATRVGVAQPRAQSFVVRAAQTLQGKVVSVNQNKTTIVAVENISVHPLYSKRVKRTTRYTAHDERGVCEIGDVVKLVPCRPLSKKKRFTVEDIVMKGNN